MCRMAGARQAFRRRSGNAGRGGFDAPIAAHAPLPQGTASPGCGGRARVRSYVESDAGVRSKEMPIRSPPPSKGRVRW
jgi:hypothetical protein